MTKSFLPLRLRFLVALIGNGSRAIASFSAGILVARGLGVQEFGVFTFIVGTFTSLRPLLDLGVSTAFYTFISRGGDIRPYLRFYSIWLAIQFVVMVSLIGLLLPAQAYHAVWLGQPRGLVLLAFIATFFQLQVWSTLAQIGESQRETLVVQSANVLIALLHLGVITALLAGHLLTVGLLVGVLLVEYVIAGFLVGLVLRRRCAPILANFPAAPAPAGVWRDFFRYCHPLILSAGAGAAFEFGDRWMLQRFGGAINQGLYQAAYQFAAISLFATTSVLQVVWKEMAEANARGDMQKLCYLYGRVSKAVFFVGASVSGLLLPWSDEIVHAMLGPGFKDAGSILGLLIIYPVHQALGQVTGTLAFATEATSIYSKVAVAFTVISLLLSYLLQAPKEGMWVPGLELGAYGLAIKMVGLNIVSVNTMAWLLARRHRWQFEWGYQVQALVLSVALGLMLRRFVGLFWQPIDRSIVALLGPMAVAGGLFAIVQLGVVFLWPAIIGQTRDELRRHCRLFLKR